MKNPGCGVQPGFDYRLRELGVVALVPVTTEGLTACDGDTHPNPSPWWLPLSAETLEKIWVNAQLVRASVDAQPPRGFFVAARPEVGNVQ